MALAVAKTLASAETVKPIDLAGFVDGSATEEWPVGKEPIGTGFAVSPAGYVLTGAHIVLGCKGIRVSGRLGSSDAVVLALDARIDAAVLRLKTQVATNYLSFGGRDVDVGEILLVPVGTNSHSGLTIITGRSMGALSIPGEGSVLAITGQFQPGASGAAVVDGDGYAEAFLIGRLRNKPNVGIAVPGQLAQRMLDYLELSSEGSHSSDTSRGRLLGATVTVQCH